MSLRPRLLALDWKDPRAYQELGDVVDVETVITHDLQPRHFAFDGLKAVVVHDADCARYLHGLTFLKDVTKSGIPVFALLTDDQRTTFQMYGTGWGADFSQVHYATSYADLFQKVRAVLQ